jgi:DNA invertase Pin-like site-specific DNA recombinase
MTPIPEKKKQLVCAIYTRKSTTEGLDQEFSSIDNQRESAENYIKSQQHEGWTASNERYDDGGFTGANIERPALQKLLAHIKEGKINCVVVYKVDRLSRSLLDFSQILEFFDKNKVVFVSITQHFNTDTSMGRLTLNILLSFAQFEREIISERTRDKMGAARKRGQWIGGRLPFGYMYDPKEKRKLIINPDAAERVHRIFSLYLEQRSCHKVANAINTLGYRTLPWTSKKGTAQGNNKFSSQAIRNILKNYAYIGKVNYRNEIYPGQQPAIIDEETFAKVNETIEYNKKTRKAYKNKDCCGFLSKVLKCSSCGSAMVHSYSIKNKRKYRYYFCVNVQRHGYSECPLSYINAQKIEDRIVEILQKEVKNLNDYSPNADVEMLLSSEWDSLLNEQKAKTIRSIIQTAEHDPTTKKIHILLKGASERLEFNSNIERFLIRNSDPKKHLFQKEPSTRRLLILAHQLNNYITEGRIKDIQQAATWLGITPSRLSHIVGLLHLSPSIQKEILTDNSPLLELIPEYKVRELSFNPDWLEQANAWQEIKKSISFKNSVSPFLKTQSTIPSKWLLQS